MDIKVELDGDETVVTKLDSDMMTAYRKAPDRPNQVLSRSWLEPYVELANDKRVSRPRRLKEPGSGYIP